MPALTFPRRAVSTATTITVNSNALPSWAPGLGEYADISLTTPQATSGVDPCPTNTCKFTGVEGQAAIWDDWNGFAFAPDLGSMGSMLLHGGGHNGYYGNEVLRYDVFSRTFSRLSTPSNYGQGYDGWVDRNTSPVVNSLTGAFPDGAPNPLHTYNNFEFLPSDAGGGSSGSVVFMHRPNSNSTVTANYWWRYDIAAGTWSNGPNAIASRVSGDTNRCALVYDQNRKGIWKMDYSEYGTGKGLSFMSFLTGVETAVSANSGNTFVLNGGSGTYHSMLTYNPDRDFLLAYSKPIGQPETLVYIDLSGFTLGVSAFAPCGVITQQGTPHPNIIGAVLKAPERLEYCPLDGNFYAINWKSDSNLFKLTVPATLTSPWVWSNELLQPKSGTSSLAFKTTRSLDNSLFGKFRYVPALKAFMWSDGNALKAQAGRPSNFT